MAANAPTRIVVTDANVIINLIHAGRIALLRTLPPYEFVVPEDVVSEIADPTQREALEAAITAGHLRRETIEAPAELTRYADLRQVIGKGEAACLALAESRGWLIASDEKRRFRREPRWTPENRPVVDGSKPASGRAPQARVFYPGPA